MSTWSFFRVADGLFTGGTITLADDARLPASTPEGCGAAPGIFDPLTQAWDVNAGVAVDYVPPKPPDTDDAAYAWDAATKRWQARATLVANKKARKAPIQLQIDALQATQHEPLRAVVLALGKAKPAPAGAMAKLQAVDDAIAPLQATLAAITAAATQAELDAIP